MEIILVLLSVLAVIIAVIANRFVDNSNPYPFTRKQSLYSPVERSFLKLLETAVGDEYKIMPRVKLMDLVETKGGAQSRAKRAALLKANAKAIDFVLCNKDTMTAVAAVDLVNNATKEGHKSKNDWFVTGALEAAGLPHIRIKIRTGYKAEEVRQCIQYKLGKPAQPARKPIVKATTIRRPAAALNREQMAASQGTQLAPVA